MMIHNEHLRKADESYEFFMAENGTVLHIYYKDEKVIIFEHIIDLINYIFLGVQDVNRAYVEETELTAVYDYMNLDIQYRKTPLNFNKLKETFNPLNESHNGTD